MLSSSAPIETQQSKHRTIRCEPRWQALKRFTNGSLPPKNRPWLTDDGSLTARLIGSRRGNFSVQRLYQGWEEPLLSERRLLDLPCRQIALIREVALLLAGEPVVFARSVFPISSLSGSLAHLRRLQNRSLGSILFNHPGMQRGPFELALLDGDSDYLPLSLQQSAPAWGRRSRFEIEGKKLMVSEVFLKSFRPWQATLPVHRTQRGKVSTAIMSATQ